MGVRLYNPSTGRFLQVDPIAGGSANNYDYCSQDPMNALDLDGRMNLMDPHGGWDLHDVFKFVQSIAQNAQNLAKMYDQLKLASGLLKAGIDSLAVKAQRQVRRFLDASRKLVSLGARAANRAGGASLKALKAGKARGLAALKHARRAAGTVARALWVSPEIVEASVMPLPVGERRSQSCSVTASQPSCAACERCRTRGTRRARRDALAREW